MITRYNRSTRPFATSFGGRFGTGFGAGWGTGLGFPLSPLLAAEFFGNGASRAEKNEALKTPDIPFDLSESDERYTLRLEVPGFRPEEIEITADQDALRVVARAKDTQAKVHASPSDDTRDVPSGESSDTRVDEPAGHVQAEESPRKARRPSREFELELGGQVDTDNIESRLELGVLEIVLPKSKAVSKRTIPVQVL